MRNTKDRIRHALSFEVIGLLLVTPLGAWTFGTPIQEIGVVTLVSATIATLWNYFFNVIFDHVLLRFRHGVQKTPAIRVLHAVLFEAGLLLILMPFIAWYLAISLTRAFLMDAGFSGFYLVYAFAFNWLYDIVFPLPVRDPQTGRSPAGS